MVDVVQLIAEKRDGSAISAANIRALVNAYTREEVPDYQMSAFLMAAFLRGMTADETFALTEAMLYSGAVLDLSAIPGTKVDKHSTGGVGDKISIVLAPVVAACGVPVPMISGRGLGHTGGTLDKLEAIPGFRTDLTLEVYRRQLADLGTVMIGQTDEIAPADRRLYALRDVTSTVECIPFIASSIMSKKLAEGIDALVLDVKCGRGAFMKTAEEARQLAEMLVAIADRFDKRCVALLTNMDQPLGNSIGNWPETREAIRCLHGQEIPDVLELVYALAGEMIWLGGRAADTTEGAELAQAAVSDGSALDLFRRLVQAQGGDPAVVDDPDSHRPPGEVIEVSAAPDQQGIVTALDPLRLGRLAVALGAGRRRKESGVDPGAGIDLLKKIGDRVQPGETICRLHTLQAGQADSFESAFRAAFSVGNDRVSVPRLILDRFHAGSWAGAEGASTAPGGRSEP